MKRLLLAATLGGALLAALPTSLSAGLIDAKTNIFVAGQDSTGINTMGGLFPAVAQTFIPGAGQTVTFDVTPSPLACGFTAPCTSAGTGDGAALVFPTGPTTGTDITANGTNGISGIIFHGREMFLAGVFLDDSIPTGAGPFTPTFVSTGGTYNADTDASFQAFFLGQVFLIGDGRTGFNNAGGTIQTWAVPANATRLFLGFADAFNNFTGPWGAYGDNSGALNVSVNVQQPSGIPEPGSLALLGLGLAGLSFSRRKR